MVDTTITAGEIVQSTHIALQQTTAAAAEGGSSSTSLTLILMALIGGAVVLGALYITQKRSGGAD